MPRLARIEVGLDYLCQTLAGHEMSKVTTDIPADARVYAAEVDFSRRCVILTVESAAFAEVPAGHVIPCFTPTATVSIDEMSMLADLVSNRHDYCPSCGEALARLLTP